AERPVVAEVAARWEGARQHVGDGLDAAVGMPGEAGAIVVRPVIAEIVEQQERIELVRLAEAEGAPQLDAGALHGGLRLDDALHGPDGHQSTSLRARPGSGCRKRRCANLPDRRRIWGRGAEASRRA